MFFREQKKDSSNETVKMLKVQEQQSPVSIYKYYIFISMGVSNVTCSLLLFRKPPNSKMPHSFYVSIILSLVRSFGCV